MEEKKQKRAYIHYQVVSLIRERDNNTCAKCGYQGKGDEKLEVHHIKPVKDNPELAFKLNNRQTLCLNCHKEIHQAMQTVKEQVVKEKPERISKRKITKIVRVGREAITLTERYSQYRNMSAGDKLDMGIKDLREKAEGNTTKDDLKRVVKDAVQSAMEEMRR